jgi:hypothetical protein
VKNHQSTISELDRRLQRLSRAQASNVEEIKQIITTWTEYADRLSQAAEHPELGKNAHPFFFFKQKNAMVWLMLITCC